jgi:hypothetical protein
MKQVGKKYENSSSRKNERKMVSIASPILERRGS